MAEDKQKNDEEADGICWRPWCNVERKWISEYIYRDHGDAHQVAKTHQNHTGHSSKIIQVKCE